MLAWGLGWRAAGANFCALAADMVPMIYLIYRLEGDRGGEDAAAFDSSATWRGYTAARRRRPNAASDERAAMRTEDEDPLGLGIWCP